MSLYGAAIEALSLRLQAFTRGGQVVLEGEPYTPIQDRGYISGRMAGYSREPTGFGENCVYRESGFYQVMIHRPVREGPLPAAQLADALVSHFPRGSGVDLGTGRWLKYENVSAQPAIIAGDWLSVPVVIGWFCTDP